jgi:16S rRNA (guanine527-N7)-methyltransferase
MNPRPLDAELLKPEAYPPLRLEGEAWRWFLAACADLEIPVEAPHQRVLEALYSHLLGVNAWLNLTRLTAPADYLKFHVFDSLTALAPVEELTAAGDLCLDLGSGGGYPGLPLMTWLPDRRWVLVDSRGKKAAFLAEAVRLTPCRQAEAASFRGREAARARPDLAQQCALVTARAIGPAGQVIEEAAALVRLNGFLLLLKGPAFAAQERQAALATAERFGFELVQELHIALDETDPDRVLVLFERVEVPTAEGARTGGRHGRPHPRRDGRPEPHRGHRRG